MQVVCQVGVKIIRLPSGQESSSVERMTSLSSGGAPKTMTRSDYDDDIQWEDNVGSALIQYLIPIRGGVEADTMPSYQLLAVDIGGISGRR